MKSWRKRLLSIICVVALVMTSVYVADYKKAKAATATSEMSITTVVWGLKFGTDSIHDRYANLNFTGVASDYAGPGSNFLDKAFSDAYITYGGGMTYEDLTEGLLTFYVATNSILQLNWQNRTRSFTHGWSFTIAKGALLPYTSTNGTSYMALDKEYTFTFAESHNGYDCELKIVGLDVATYSLGSLGIWGNATSGAQTTIAIDSIDGVSNWNTTYTYIHDDASYEQYFAVSDLTFDKLNGDIKLRYILDGGTTCFQMEDWGSLRTSMTKGDQLIFRKGLPMYFTDGNGTQWKALLDATYVYECTGPNSDNTQVFYGVKIDDSTPKYGLNTLASQTTDPQGNEQYINVNFDYATAQAQVVQAHDVSEDILTDKIAEDYIEIANYTIAQAREMGIAFRYIPRAGCIQMAFGTKAIENLKVGDTITMKAGMPVVYLYDGALYAAKLDAGYIFTVTANDGTRLTFSRKLYDTYSLTGSTSGPHAEGSNKYLGLPITPDEFEDASQRGEWRLAEADWKSYVTLSNHTYDQMIAGGVHIRQYTYLASTYQGIRFYSADGFAFEDGEQLTLKKGLPVEYNTNIVSFSDGSGLKAKVTCLDKDYVFVYSASTGKFTYDPSLGNVEEDIDTTETFTFKSTGAGSFYEVGAYKSNLVYSTNLGVTTDATAVNNILASTGEAGNTRDYVEIFGMEPEMIDTLGITIMLYPADGTTTFQMVWGADVFEWIETGMILTFKAGMPVYYATGDVMYLTADTSYQVTSVTQPTEIGNGVFVLTSYEPPLPVKKFAISTADFGSGIADGGMALIDVLNAETGEANVLNDAKTAVYKWVGGSETAYDQLAKWIDIAGLTAKELEAYGVSMRLVGDGATQVLQIFWGTCLAAMGEGSQITFKAGMPFTYVNKDGKSQTIELDRDYTFEASGSNVDNKCIYRYFTMENSGAYALKYGTTFVVAQEEVAPGVIHYYNNIYMVGGELLAHDTAMRVAVPVGTLMEYLEFGNIDPIHYEALGITATLIIDGDIKVMQLDWGRPGEHTITDANGNTVTTTDLVKDGDRLTFKAGMAIQTEVDSGQKQRYVLDKSYTYTIEAHSTGANGYRLSGVVKEEEKITTGDADGDYLLNQNDITLLRKQLVGLIAVSNTAYVNANEDKDGVISSADLVRAKQKWNVAEPETYTTIYENCEIPSIIIKKDKPVFTTDSEIGMNAISIADNNYIRLTYSTTEDIYGTFHYTNNGTPYEEDFYLPAKDVQFEQFFDNYRSNGVLGTTKATAKTLTKITFRNVGEEEAIFNLVEVEVANRPFENSNMLYVNNGSLKIGVDLNQGGSLTYMEDLVNKPIEYTTSRYGGNLKIATQEKYSSGSNALTEVNLVNIYDLGRQMQQSYYIDVKDGSYTHGQYNNNPSWPYNPVQAGDKNEHQSQIIDYRKIDTDGDSTQDMIYVKVRAMDWADPNPNGTDTATARGTTTESYMESWFRISGELLYVDNAFVDWSGWQSVGNPVNQELPAFYTLASMNYFVAGNDTTTRKTYGNWTNENDRYHVTGEDTSDWYAWVNADADDAYGLGIYIPNAHACTAGRGQKSSNASFLYPSNSGAGDAEIFDVVGKYGTYLDDLYKGNYQNCFLGNTSYIAPTALVALQEYTTYSYTYVLHANELNEMSETFEDLEDEVTNSQLSGW